MLHLARHLSTLSKTLPQQGKLPNDGIKETPNVLTRGACQSIFNGVSDSLGGWRGLMVSNSETNLCTCGC